VSKVTPQPIQQRQFWLLVPTFNPGVDAWTQWVYALQAQNCKPSQVIVVDSGSTDGTLELSQQAGFSVFHTRAKDFNHGGTRQWALEQALQLTTQPPEFVVLLTQDALLNTDNALAELLKSFDNPKVAATYGRQIAKEGASWLEGHARSFNYPEVSRTVQWEDKARLGIKACFLSNSFAAYRLKALQQVGGFPSNFPLGEDTYTAAQLLKEGHHIGYQASASVYHSHNYNGRQDFQRMFDTGVFHAQNPWMLQSFGAAEGEGIKLLVSQWRFLTKSNRVMQTQIAASKPNVLLGIAQLLAVNFIKLLGYKLGRAYPYLPQSLVYKFAMHKPYWQPRS
jgi:rhamnosyltransferase